MNTAPFPPILVSGRLLGMDFAHASSAPSTAGLTTPSTATVPVYIPRSFTAAQLYMWVSVGAAGLGRLSLYAADASGGPGTLLGFADAIDVSTAGLKIGTMNVTVPLAAETIYWVGVHGNVTFTLVSGSILNWTGQSGVGTGAGSVGFTRSFAYASGAPNPFGSTLKHGGAYRIGVVVP